MEAFKRGLFDARTEYDPTRWQTAYSFPALRDGLVVKEAYPTGLPKPSNYFVFNTRREVFRDVRVREALSYLLDFEWLNRSYFFDLYRRTAGYFDGSELSSFRAARRGARKDALSELPGFGARGRVGRHLVSSCQRWLRSRPNLR